jgi:hypothetical protein
MKNKSIFKQIATSALMACIASTCLAENVKQAPKEAATESVAARWYQRAWERFDASCGPLMEMEPRQNSTRPNMLKKVAQRRAQEGDVLKEGVWNVETISEIMRAVHECEAVNPFLTKMSAHQPLASVKPKGPK